MVARLRFVRKHTTDTTLYPRVRMNASSSMRRASTRDCNRSEARRLERINSRTNGIAGAITVHFGLQNECKQRLVRRLLAFYRRNCTMVADGRRRKARGVGTIGRASRCVTAPGAASKMRVLERGCISSNNVL